MTIDSQELGRRLRDARNSAGLSQEAAADHLGLSRTSLTQIENGKRSVSGLELDHLAQLYGRAIQDFLRPDFTAEQDLHAFFRLNPEFEGGEERLALQKCIALAREISQLEKRLEIAVEPGACYDIGAPRSRSEAIVQGNRVAEEERRRLDLGDAPIMHLRELLESEGIRSAALALPKHVSGVTLFGAEVGRFVVAQAQDSYLRQRFSFAHEYAHVLMDSRGPGRVSRKREDDNIEVRANAFAASFLLPEDGVRDLVAGLGSATPMRGAVRVFNGDEGADAPIRDSRPHSDVNMLVVAHVAHHFGVSRLAAIYRMYNIGLFDRDQLERLVEDDSSGKGNRMAHFLGLPDAKDRSEQSASTRRLQLLGLEALRRGLISKQKFIELLTLAGLSSEDAETFVWETCENNSVHEPSSNLSDFEREPF